MWQKSILILLQYLNLAFCDGTYECGDHGRFEYCIDEIPGCVIGCHCHPGYYFDSDTKICEPNSKLIEHHRRHYVVETTRSYILTPSQNIVTSPVATTSKIDGAINEISKDTEDLGDWIYNQFFKTIENQVINSTNDQNTLTRRSGSASAKSKRTPKRSKKTKKRRKSKHKIKLMGKLENDSVFDLSSSSNSESSESTSSSSDSSLEYERYYKRHDDDDEHGHKKIVMIKKKPKQNLPNFIFLPNVETPFYPPVGLPPPPIPMYPMVPVPPTVPFFHIDEIETTAALDKTTTDSKTTTGSTRTEVTTTEETTGQNEQTEPVKFQFKINGIHININNLHLDKMTKKDLKLSNNNKTKKNLRSMKMMSPSRQKFIQRLKQKTQNQSAKSLKHPWMRNKNTISNSVEKEDDNVEYPYLGNIPDSYMINDVKQNTRDGPTISENVDFKYISELIHRDDLHNDSKKLPPIEYNPLDSIEPNDSTIQKEKRTDYIIPPNTLANRSFLRPHYQKSDESYCTNLGRQIASMIRGINTQNKELNIQVEATHDVPKNDIFLKVSSPRSYWERSVQSPLTFLNSNKKNFECLKNSNELLFDIENKVEIVASTVPTLTLREIENIVSVMETAKRKMQGKETIVEDVVLPKNNLNINLWPKSLPNTRNLMTNSISSNLKNNIKLPIPSPTTNISQKNKPDHLHGFSMTITNRLTAQQNPQAAGKSNFDTLIIETKSKIKPDDHLEYYQSSRQTLTNPKYVKNTYSDQNPRQPLWDHDVQPFFLKHRKYFDHSHDYLLNQNEKFPYTASNNGEQKSYFLQEINSFDRIE